MNAWKKLLATPLVYTNATVYIYLREERQRWRYDYRCHGPFVQRPLLNVLIVSSDSDFTPRAGGEIESRG